jgi:hypothetical protein
MAKIDAKKLYLQIKKRETSYKEELHCPMIIDVMNTDGTMSAFCAKALISDALFYKWCNQHPVFERCYQIGRMLSKDNWEKEGEAGKDDENFNLEYWRITGACRYGVGRSNRIRMAIDSEASPYDQYKQLIKQANGEEFTASEIKQLMESINIGRSVYETFKLQERIDTMESSVKQMELNNAHNSGAIEKA